MAKFIFRTSTLLLLSLSVLISHGEAKTLEQGVLSCSSIDNALKRLVCFDEITKDIKSFDSKNVIISKNVATPEVKVTTVDKISNNAEEKRQVEEFGKEAQSKSSSYIDGDSLVAEVKSIKVLNTKKVRVVLSDGHIWEQTSSETFGRPKKGNTIVITKGAIGAFYMKVQGSKRRIRVKRIQ